MPSWDCRWLLKSILCSICALDYGRGDASEYSATIICGSAQHSHGRRKRIEMNYKVKFGGLLLINRHYKVKFRLTSAILVPEIIHGLQPQTVESPNLLKLRNAKFFIALKKLVTAVTRDEISLHQFWTFSGMVTTSVSILSTEETSNMDDLSIGFS
ncbi:hypothetical protein Peur_000500 [Populus x canadensis]